MSKRSLCVRLILMTLVLSVLIFPSCIRVEAANNGKTKVVDDEKEFIQAIYDNLLKGNKTFTLVYEGDWEEIYQNDIDELFRKVCAIDDKNTSDDFDYMKGNLRKYTLSYTWNDTHCEFDFIIEYRETRAQTKKVNSTIKSELKKMKLSKASNYTKVKKIHDFIVNRVTYDTSYQGYTAYDALANKESVCQGYALLFYKMATEAGVPCRIVTSDDHAWNIVKIGKKWYHVDTTWDDPISSKPILRYDYFMKGSDTMANDHVLSPEFRTKTFKKKYPISKNDYKKK